MDKTMSFDDGLLDIVVGWELAKEMGASILNHKINEKTYWTFLPREKRKIFEEQIKDFIKLGYTSLIKDILLENVDPINFETKDSYLKHLSDVISGKTGYLYSGRLYIYCGKKMYHIDLNLLDFMLWDIKDNIVEMIDEIEINLEDYREDLRYLDRKYIPYLIDAEEDNISSNVH